MNISATPNRWERLTRTEYVAVFAIVFLAATILFSAVPRALAAREMGVCQANLKRIGEAVRMYATEDEGEYFPRAKWRDCLGGVQPWSGAMNLEGVVPEYLESADYFVCPAYPAGKTALEVWDEGKTTNPRWTDVAGFSRNGTVDPCEVLGKPYYYYGWALSERTFEGMTKYVPAEPEDSIPRDVKGGGIPVTTGFSGVHLVRFAVAVKALADDAVAGNLVLPPEEWKLHYPNGKAIELPMGSVIPRLCAGAERFYIRDIGNPLAAAQEEAKVVVLHEELRYRENEFYHGDRGVNVLYMDGHVAYLESPDFFPGIRFPLHEAGYILRDAVEGTLEFTETGERVRHWAYYIP